MQLSESLPQLGTVQKDKITGYEGVVTTVAYHIAGCNRIGLRSQEPSEADETKFFYPTQLEQVEEVDESLIIDEPTTEVGFDLGWHLQNKINGANGIATTITFNLYNCPRVAMTPFGEEPPEEPQDRFWADAPEASVVNKPDDNDFLDTISKWVDNLKDGSESETGAKGEDYSTRSSME